MVWGSWLAPYAMAHARVYGNPEGALPGPIRSHSESAAVAVSAHPSSLSNPLMS